MLHVFTASTSADLLSLQFYSVSLHAPRYPSTVRMYLGSMMADATNSRANLLTHISSNGRPTEPGAFPADPSTLANLPVDMC